MSLTFAPKMNVLPRAQQRIWPSLRNAAKLGFVLYGGTALALRLGHRPSVDFDFFSDAHLDRRAIYAGFPFLASSTVIRDADTFDTLTFRVASGAPEEGVVKLSFFGTISFGRVGEPEFTEDRVLQVASLDDLMATKVKVVLQRAEAKDYYDIAAMILAGVSLSRGLASAAELFGPNFQPSESLKAITYFKDGDLKTLDSTTRNTLIRAAEAVRELPQVIKRSSSLGCGSQQGSSFGSQPERPDADNPGGFSPS